MNCKAFTWSNCLLAIVISVAGACSSNNGANNGQNSGTPSGGTGGQPQGGTGGKAGQGGQPATGGKGGNAGSGGAGGNAGNTAGQGGARNSGGVGGTAGTAGSAGGGQGGASQPKDAGELDAGSADAGTGKDSAPDVAPVVDHPRQVILADEGNTRVHRVDLKTRTGGWTKQFESFRDVQLVGGDRLAVSTLKGYVELDINTGVTKKEFTGLDGQGIETLRRLPNGHTVFGGNSDGGITIQELDDHDTPVAGHKTTFAGMGPLRLLRRTPQGTFLINYGTEGNKVAEVSWDKKVIWDMDVPNGKHTYNVMYVADNTIALSSGYGAQILIVDRTAKTVKTYIGGPNQPNATKINPHFYAGFQVLTNGNFVVTNWQNHGGGHGNEGIQLLEYTQSGELVWSWQQDATLVSSLHGVIVLDGLDTSKLHDYVNGVLAPVEQ